MIKNELLNDIENGKLSNEDITWLLESLCRLGVKSKPNLTPKVIIYLQTRLTLDHVTREEIAKYFHMSSRTLSRKLKKENTGFQALLNEERKRRCLHCLRSNIVRGNDLVELLGLSDISHFYKSFKLWTGYSFSEAKTLMAENHHNIDSIFQRHDRKVRR